MKQNRYFIEQVAHDLVDRMGWNGLKDCTIVFPMHRAGLFMKDALKAKMLAEEWDKPVVAPRLTTLSELVDELCAPYMQAEDEIHSICRLYQLFCEQTGWEMGLDLFYDWGRQLLTDFSNADASEVDAMALFRNSADARELEELQLEPETMERLSELVRSKQTAEQQDSIRRQMKALWAALPKVYEAFQKQGAGYPGARLKYVVEHFDQIRPALEGRRLVFVGFNYLLGKEHALMRLLHEADMALFYWDHWADFRTNESAFKYTKRHKEEFGQALPETDEQGTKAVRVIATSSLSAQAQYVHQWLEERADAKGRIGVVIADENMLEPVIYALPERLTGRVNITKGYPLKQTKVFTQIIRYLSDPAHDKREGETYAAVLRRLQEKIDGMMASERPTQPTDLTWQQALIQESYYQAQVVLNRFCQLIDDGTLSQVQQMSTLRNLLRKHLQSVTLPFHGDPITQVQVIGVLETRLLDFEHLLVLNVEEGVVPQTQADNSFIPYYLRKYYHMPTGGESAEVYAYNFFRLLRRASDVTLLFSNAAEGDQQKSMSRFVMQLLTSGEYRVERLMLEEGALVESGELEVLDHARVPLWNHWEQWRPDKPKKTLSPSDIGTYLECPRKFYLQNVLGLSYTEPDQLIMRVNDQGTLVHGALEAAYNSMRKNHEDRITVTPEMIAELLRSEDKLSQALDESFVALNKDYAKHHTLAPGQVPFVRSEHPAESQVALEQMKNVLLKDQESAQHGLTILEMEKWHGFDVDLEVDGEKRHLTIGGYLDRLDEVGGQLRVVDYKTGSPAQKTKAAALDELFAQGGEKKYMMQILLYCHAQKASGKTSVRPQLCFTKQKDCFFTLEVNRQPLDNYGDYEEAYLPLLKQTVTQILTDDTFPQCEKDCKSYCPFLAFCGREKKAY